MGIITVYITVNNIGADTGPFDLYDNNQKLIATNISQEDLISGVSLDIKDTTTQISIFSKGICNNSLNVPVTTFPISATPTPTPTVTSTESPTPTPTTTRTPSLSPSKTPSITISPSKTPSITISPSKSISPTVTPSISISESPSVTPSISPSVTATPSISISESPSPTPSISISNTPSITLSNTPSATVSISPSRTPSVTPSPTVNNVISWSFSTSGVSTGASMTIYRGGSTVVSTGINGASGTFTYTSGQSIEVVVSPNIKTLDYTSACVYRPNGALQYSDGQTEADSNITFNASLGGYVIRGYQSTSGIVACAAP